MISYPEFGTIFSTLEKRFKALTDDQRHVYYDRLKHYESSVLRDSINALVDTTKFFPTPGDIKDAVREILHNRAKSGNAPLKTKGCAHCHDGYVFYERLKHDKLAMYVGDCAYCHRGEISIQAQVVQKDNRIFDACEQVQDGGTTRYRANPDMLEEYREASAVKTDDEMRRRFENA